jgi:hypothetical protein
MGWLPIAHTPLGEGVGRVACEPPWDLEVAARPP